MKKKKKLKHLKLFDAKKLPVKGNRPAPVNDFTVFAGEETRQSVSACFEKRVKVHAGRAAVKCGNETVTYGFLDRYANRAARLILAACAGKNGPGGAALLFGHGIGMIIGIMGTLKAGKIYVPLDPGYPPGRLEYMLRDSAAVLIVTGGGYDRLARQLRDRVDKNIKIVDIDDIPAGIPGAPPGISIHPDQPAYVLYTSGSTGRPKGVMQGQRNLLHFAAVYTNGLRIHAGDRLSLFSSYGFDAAQMDIFGALLNGALLLPFDIKQEESLYRLPGWLEKEKITIYHSIPTLYRYFIDIHAGRKNPGVFNRIRFVVLGGEAVYKNDVEKYKRYFPGDCIFINGLGPTESTVTLQYFIDRETVIAGETVPVGFPAAETEVFLLDKDNKEAVVNAVGEIIYKSDYLSPGYLNEPGKTHDVFGPDPLTGGGRVYRSGDLGRRLEDGSIEYAGRKDSQVKIRGYRVELGEIEGRLDGLAGIKKSVVVNWLEGGENYLIAYYVGAGNKEGRVDESILAAKLKEGLPDYMIPRAFFRLAEFPRTATGKIHRGALPEPGQVFRKGAKFKPPVTAVEKKLAQMWSEVLGLKGEAGNIGTAENFFEIGGHSLKAIILAAKIRKDFQVDIPLVKLFEAPTIEELGRYIASAGVDVIRRLEPAAVEKRDYYPLSAAQKRLFTLQQLEKTGTGYNMPVAYTLSGALVRERFSGAVARLVRRHEALRTCFFILDGTAVQRVYDRVDFAAGYYEAEPSAAGALDTAGIIKDFVRPFDLGKAPLSRIEIREIALNRYLMLLDIHHIISDGTSTGILTREFSAFYDGESVPRLKIQYKDYSVWQQEVLAAEGVLEKEEDYWLEEFKDGVPVLELPTDFPRPLSRSFAGDRVAFMADQSLARGLNRLAGRTGATLFMVLLTAYYTLLHRCTGREDMVVGCGTANRPHVDVQDMVGMFVNMLAMRNAPAGAKTFNEFLEEVKKNAVDAFRNQHYQFDTLVESLNIHRDPSRNPVFDAAFVVQNMDIFVMKKETLQFTPMEFENKTSKFDIFLAAAETGTGIRFSLEYCTALFRKESIERMTGHYLKILEDVVRSEGHALLGRIKMVSEDERRQLLLEFNDTGTDFPAAIPIHRLFAGQVDRTPDKVALVEWRDGSPFACTYRQLDERAGGLARVLAVEQGVDPGSPVGVLMGRSAHLVAVFLGILKAGGAYLPIDPDLPGNRIKAIIDDSALRLILSLTQYIKRTGNLPAGSLLLDVHLCMDGPDAPHRDGIDRYPATADPGSRLAYIMYTSGSTGLPKGVVAEHKNVVRLVKNTDYIDFAEDDRILQTGTVQFDASTFEIWGALLNGLTLVLEGKDSLLGPGTFKTAIVRNRITTLWMTASFFNLMSDADIEIFVGLKNLLVGGEALSPPHIHRLRNRFPRLNVINGYGPTENVTFSTTCRIDKNYKERIPIGKPIANSTAYVVDKNVNLQPVGVPGELCVGGHGVARGYLNDAELTAEKFLTAHPSPFTLHPSPLYKTGDLAKWLPDGNIEYLGRMDSQVKIRGFRIELGEIEVRLLEHEDIKEAVVTVREDAAGDKFLCAYVVPRPPFLQSAFIDSSGLKDHLCRFLSGYMVPAVFVALEKLPLTPNGKADKKALEKIYRQRGLLDPGSNDAVPRDGTEEKLLKIWQEILGVARIGINDNFFRAGGHSLKATRLVSRINKELSVEIGLRDIFAHQTIAGLAGIIKQKKPAAFINIQPTDEREYYDVSHAQKRLWILDRMEKAGPAYNIDAAVNFKGPLDTAALNSTFRALIQRHESLRTCFRAVNGVPVQMVHKKVDFVIEEVSLLEEGEPTQREEEAKKIAGRHVGKVFDLTRVPLLKVVLIKVSQDRHILLFSMPHIIGDGWSMNILVEELVAFYKAFGGDSRAVPGSVPAPLRIHYKDYARWQKARLASASLLAEKQREYWRRKLSGDGDIPVLDFPADYPRPAIKTFNGNTSAYVLEKKLSAGLNSLCKKQGVTLFMLLLAAVKALIYRYTGREDIIVGSPIAGRNHPDLEDQIGFYVNTLALRGRVGGGEGFDAFLRQVKQTAEEAYENQNYPFDKLVDELNLDRDTSRQPLFDVMVIMQNNERPGVKFDNIEVTPFDAGDQYHNTSKFDLIFSFTGFSDEILMSIEYNSDLFKRDRIERFYSHFTQLVESIVRDTAQEIQRINILTGEERQRLLVEFNDTDVELPPHKTVTGWFDGQVERIPDHTAVIDAGVRKQHLTYRELNKKSHGLALYLVEHYGITPGDIVAVTAERSYWVMVALLAILKASGVYLPIDPGYPKDRIDFMLKDSGARILLSFLLDKSPLEGRGPKGRGVSGPKNRGPQPAYIIYTSGSTGKPKGVMGTYGCLTNLIHWQMDRYRWKNGFITMLYSALNFDVSLQEMLFSVCSGGAIYMIPDDLKRDPDRLLSFIAAAKIQLITLPFSALNLLFYKPGIVESILTLKYIITSGEQLQLTGNLRRFLEARPDVTLDNQYGPSETHVVTGFILSKARDNLSPLPPIGKPIANTRCFILDRAMNPVPIGIGAELYLSGANLAAGYLNHPQLTAKRFCLRRPGGSFEKPPPGPPQNFCLTGKKFLWGVQGGGFFKKSPPGRRRHYKTGDLARWLVDGNIEFLGRIDFQVKIRGFRVEPGEIENRLLSLKGIKEAVVIALDDEKGETFLCAYIVAERKVRGESIPALREYLKKELPDYMVPRYFVRMKNIPLTPSGKIHRKALPAPHFDAGAADRYAPPRNRLEEKIIEIWSEVLHIDKDKISIEANFFEMGGHSLKAAVMTAKIHEQLNVKLPLLEVFNRKTVKGLSRYIGNAEEDRFIRIRPVERKEYYVLSPGQMRIYIIQQMDLESTAYNMPGIIHLKETPDIEKLHGAFIELIRRHESLRTSFHMVGDVPVQGVNDEAEFGVECFYLAAKSAKGREEKIIRDFIRPFDLFSAPLLRVGLIKQEEKRYLLLVDMHHIISDGISHDILAKDFAALYQGQPLASLAIQYKEYSEWHDRNKEAGALQAQERYWLKEFAGEIPILNLPLDYPRPALQSFDGNIIDFELGTEETKALKALARTHGATLFMVLLTVCTAFLAKIAGQEDIVLGTPVAGRRHADLEKIIGIFINTLALRNYPSAEKRFDDFLAEVTGKTARAFDNQDYPFKDLVEKTGTDKDMSRNPLFDAVITFQDTGAVLPGKEVNKGVDAYIHRPSKFDLGFIAKEGRGKLLFTVEYCVRLFKRETVERFARCFKRAVSAAAGNPRVRLRDIEILPDDEKWLVLYEFNRTKTEYDGTKTVHSLFEEGVIKNPANTALVSKDTHLTYETLNRQANRLAWTLRERGVVRDGIVGIMPERGPEMIIGILGILKAGGAYLPLDDTYPEERNRFMLTDSGVDILLDKRFCRGQGVGIDNPEHINQAGDMALILYTSGSTGRPKGVALLHRGVVNVNNLLKETLEMTSRDRVLLFGSPAFDASLFETIMALFPGASLHILPKEVIYNYRKYEDTINKYCITTVLLPPAFLSHLQPGRVNENTLRVMISGGARAEYREIDRWKEKTRFFNGYGPTEITILCSMLKYHDNAERPATVPIGKPIPNQQVYILDKHGHPSPTGTAGELYVAGDGLARGYLNRPVLTKQKFLEVRKPFFKKVFGRRRHALPVSNKLYKTGDSARWLADGSIEFLGRIDAMVKIRGFRIEPGEVEQCLVRHPDISEAVVIAVEIDENEPETGGQKELTAFIVGHFDLSPGITAAFREHLGRFLPNYMIPHYFVKLEKLPLTPSDKIDRKALAKLAAEAVAKQSANSDNYAPPRDEIEKKLVKIWREVLQRKKIGINDNFFDSGGHSLKAAQITARIQKEISVEIGLRDIFAVQTIAGLAGIIKREKPVQFIDIKPAEEREYYDLSNAQRRLWVLHQFEEAGASYNIPAAYILGSRVDTRALNKAFRGLIYRHESLRTGFAVIEGEPRQIIHKKVDFSVQVEAGSGSSIGRHAAAVFDLSKAPLLDVKLLKLSSESQSEGGEGKYILLFNIHHIISDGWSVEILIEELAAFYNAFAGSVGTLSLPPIRIQYRDYALWQNTYLASGSGAAEKQRSYWRQKLCGEGKVPRMDFPADYPRPAVRSYNGDSLYYVFDKELAASINRLCKGQGVTLFMFLSAAVNVLVYRYTGREDIITGSPISGRNHPDLEDQIGFYVNTLPFRNRLKGGEPFETFLGQVGQTTTEAYENQVYPFDRLVEDLLEERDLSRHPFFDIVVDLYNQPPGSQLQDIEISPYSVKTRVSKFDLTFNFVSGGDRVALSLEYCTDLFKRATVQRLVNWLENVIRSVIENPSLKLADICLVSEEEEQIMVDAAKTPLAGSAEEIEADFDL